MIGKSNKDVVEILHIKNVRIRNKHNNVLFPCQNIMKIIFRNGESRTIDLFSERDMTSIKYFEIVETNRTKKKIIFKEND